MIQIFNLREVGDFELSFKTMSNLFSSKPKSTSLATAKDIPELTTPSGSTTQNWEEMAHITTNFFTNILGNPAHGAGPGIDQNALQEILYHQADRVNPLEKEILNAPLTLEELGEALRAMVREVPGARWDPDRVLQGQLEHLWPSSAELLSRRHQKQKHACLHHPGSHCAPPKKS